MEKKIETLKAAISRGFFERDDAEAFGKAMLWIGKRDLTRLGISEEQLGTCFYRMAAFDVEPEVVGAGQKLGLTTIHQEDGSIEFSFFPKGC